MTTIKLPAWKIPLWWEKVQEALGVVGLVMLALLVVGVLQGCAALSPKAPTADVSVAVSCVDERPDRPAFRDDVEILALEDYKVVEALRAERIKAQLYIVKLEDVVTICERAPTIAVAPGKP